jgi:hypothetical protein
VAKSNPAFRAQEQRTTNMNGPIRMHDANLIVPYTETSYGNEVGIGNLIRPYGETLYRDEVY